MKKFAHLGRLKSRFSRTAVYSIALVGAFFLPQLQFAEAGEGPSAKKRSLPAVGFSVPGGYFEAGFSLKLSSPVDGAIVRYTVDGSEPSMGSGYEYSDALSITNTTAMRTAAFKERTRVSSVTTRSYICLEQVIHQPARPAGFPAGAAAWKGQPSAYEMSRRVVDDPA